MALHLTVLVATVLVAAQTQPRAPAVPRVFTEQEVDTPVEPVRLRKPVFPPALLAG